MTQSVNRHLLPGESVIAVWSTLTLTNHRLWSYVSADGVEQITTLVVSHIDGGWVRREAQPVFLVMAVVCAATTVVAIAMTLIDSSTLGIVMTITLGLLALVFVIVYFATRKTSLQVHAGALCVAAQVDGTAPEIQQARTFLNAVERAVLRV